VDGCSGRHQQRDRGCRFPAWHSRSQLQPAPGGHQRDEQPDHEHSERGKRNHGREYRDYYVEPGEVHRPAANWYRRTATVEPDVAVGTEVAPIVWAGWWGFGPTIPFFLTPDVESRGKRDLCLLLELI